MEEVAHSWPWCKSATIERGTAYGAAREHEREMFAYSFPVATDVLSGIVFEVGHSRTFGDVGWKMVVVVAKTEVPLQTKDPLRAVPSRNPSHFWGTVSRLSHDLRSTVP